MARQATVDALLSAGEIAEAADGLRRILDALDDGTLRARELDRAHLAGAVAALDLMRSTPA